MTAGPFADDIAFLKQHTSLVLLTGEGGAQVAVSPAYQGRVLTSTTGGDKAPSFGWLGREAIASGTLSAAHERVRRRGPLLAGPEGGQYALYFKPGDPFDLPHWQTPAPFDWDPWDIADQLAGHVRFQKRMSLVNYAGTPFASTSTARCVSWPPPTRPACWASCRRRPSRRLRVRQHRDQRRRTAVDSEGRTRVDLDPRAVPAHARDDDCHSVRGWPESALGPIVNDAYFGKVPSDRLRTTADAILFKADGRYRAKIGVSPARTLGVAGSYDASRQVLTIVQFTRDDARRDYVNSMWEIQREPYKGDALNSYNDGPPGPGQKPLGPFYELESSSPALALQPGQHYTHEHRTFHLTGPEASLDAIARKVLKVGLPAITSAFVAK